MARLENPAGAAVGGAPTAHKTSHEPGGTDALTALTDASVAAANKDGAAGTASLRTLGTGATQAAAGTDSRLSDARAPTSHQTSHEPGGSDALALLTDASFAAANKDGAAGTASLRTLGTGATQAAPGTVDAAAGTGSVRTLGSGAAKAAPGTLAGVWRPTTLHGVCRFGSAAALGLRPLPANGTGALPGVGMTTVVRLLFLAAAELAAAGLTPELRVTAQLIVDGTVAPAATFKVGLYPVTSGAGVNGVFYTLGTLVAGSEVTFATPAAAAVSHNSAVFAVPGDNTYCLGVDQDAVTAATSEVHVSAALELHYT